MGLTSPFSFSPLLVRSLMCLLLTLPAGCGDVAFTSTSKLPMMNNEQSTAANEDEVVTDDNSDDAVVDDGIEPGAAIPDPVDSPIGTPDPNDIPPEQQQPGKAQFYSCLNYEKTTLPLRVDVYSVPQTIADEYESIRTSSCAHDGSFVDCYDDWLQLKVLSEPRSAQVYSQKNYLTQFCMTHFDVGERSFKEGFPKNDGSNTKVPRTSWFAFNAWSYLKIPADGMYSFSMISDDGAKLLIDEKIIVDNDGAHGALPLDGATTGKGSVQLTAGNHRLNMLYFQGPPDGIALQLFWKAPGSTSWQVIPKTAFEFWKN